MKTFFSLIIIGSLVLMLGCSSDKDENKSNPTGPTTADDAPTFITHKVELPANMQNSNDQHAQTVVIYTNLANLFSATLNGYFVPPSLNKASGDGPWQHVWQEDELNITVLIKKLTDRYTWEVSYTGQDDDGNVFQNFIAFRAEQALDESSGAFTMYDPESEVITGQYAWSVDENSTLHFEVSAEQQIKGVKFVGMVNTDRSGVLELFNTLGETDMLQTKYQWDSDGLGEWWEYDAAGNLIDSGTWS